MISVSLRKREPYPQPFTIMANKSKDPGKEKPVRPKQHQARQPGRESEMKPLPEYENPKAPKNGRLAGLVALVTGEDSGIGRAVAVAFANEGADVAVLYLEECTGRDVFLASAEGSFITGQMLHHNGGEIING
jgi:hypothetical protein